MIISIIHIIVSYDQNILLIFYLKDGSHVSLWHQSFVYFMPQRQHTAVQKMRTHLKKLSLHYNFWKLSKYLWLIVLVTLIYESYSYTRLYIYASYSSTRLYLSQKFLDLSKWTRNGRIQYWLRNLYNTDYTGLMFVTCYIEVALGTRRCPGYS